MGLGQRTNSPPQSTARRILEHARNAFNERGVTAVGIRDIARELGLSPGNVSYHFPTKEALVTALIEEVHSENNRAVHATDGPLDFVQVDAMLRAIMRRDLENRWVMRDAVGLLVALPALRPLEARLQRAREARVDALVEHLIAAGLLDRRRSQRALELLRVQLITQVFFWLPAAVVAAPDADPIGRFDLHARAAMGQFLGYCTPAGRRKLERLLNTTSRSRPSAQP